MINQDLIVLLVCLGFSSNVISCVLPCVDCEWAYTVCVVADRQIGSPETKVVLVSVRHDERYHCVNSNGI